MMTLPTTDQKDHGQASSKGDDTRLSLGVSVLIWIVASAIGWSAIAFSASLIL